MAEGAMGRPAKTRAVGGIGWVPGLLLAAAAIDLVIQSLAQASYGPASGFEPGRIVGQLMSASVFVLAAAVVFGMDRWPLARPWLIVGVFALVIRGVLDVALEGWMWWLFAGPSDRLAELTGPGTVIQGAMYVRGLVALLAGAAAPALLAAGLFMAQPLSAANRARRRAIICMVALGVVALAAHLLVAVTAMGRSPEPWLEAPYELLLGLSYAATALLGAAALHRLPRHYRMPELLIAIGAAMFVANAAWQTVVWLGVILDAPFGLIDWPQWLPNYLGFVGMAAIIGGFAVARIVPPRGARPPERAW